MEFFLHFFMIQLDQLMCSFTLESVGAQSHRNDWSDRRRNGQFLGS